MAKKKVRLTTPKGIAKYPWLTKPDTKFDSDGVYRVSLRFKPEEVQEFLDLLDKMADDAYEKAKEKLIKQGKKAQAKKVIRHEPYTVEYDQEGEETGYVEVKFKSQFEPALFDAQGQEIDRDSVLIYGGSILRVNFTPSQYYVAANKLAGVKLNLNAVQVLELVSKGGSAEYFGFEIEEDGFTVDDFEDTHATDDAIDSDDDFDITEEDF